MRIKHNQSGHLGAAVVLIFVLVALFGGFILVVKRQQGSGKNNNESSEKTTTVELKGLSFSPKSLSGSNISDFFDKAKVLGGVVTWAGDWQDLDRTSGGPNLVVAKSVKSGLLPIVITTTHTDAGQGKVKAIRALSDSQKESYIQAAADFSLKNKPAYMGLGIEVNRIYESSAPDYLWFVDLFNKSADAVHLASPGTKVFTTFQLERVKGLKGGLFGGQNNEQANNWSLIKDFASADLIGFTSYPGLIFHSPSEIPNDYYASIFSYSPKPILFSELGWPAGDVATGWNGTPELQQQFVDRFFELTSSFESKANIWSFLYDPETAVPFNTMGMFSLDGTERAAWQEYINAKK